MVNNSKNNIMMIINKRGEGEGKRYIAGGGAEYFNNLGW